MAIKLSDETSQRVISSIKRYVSENMEEEIGDLKARMMLDFFLEEDGSGNDIGPAQHVRR